MTLQRLEAEVLQHVEHVLQGGRIEDDLVECKGQWPNPSTVARQLAGHANRGRGGPILWIVGLDETARLVTGASDIDIANWWPQVLSAFDDGVAPELTHLVVPVAGGATVVALQFDTSRAPYVVTRGTGTGQFERDVPWREGTRTRSAHRRELLRMLVQAVGTPDAEIYWLQVSARQEKAQAADRVYRTEAKPECISFHISGSIFFIPSTPDLVVLPDYRMKGKLSAAGVDIAFSVSIRNRFVYRSAGSKAVETHPLGVQWRHEAVYIAGPGDMRIEGSAEASLQLLPAFQEARVVEVSFEFPLAQADQSIRLTVGTQRREPDQDESASSLFWEFS